MFVKDSLFHDYTTAIEPYDSMQVTKIISTFYKNNFQNKKVKTPTAYHALDLAILWFVNTTGCRRCLALICFMSNSFFTRQTAHFCYDNCMYDKWHGVDLEVSIFERHDITAQHCQRYLTTNKYIQAAKIQRTESTQY